MSLAIYDPKRLARLETLADKVRDEIATQRRLMPNSDFGEAKCLGHSALFDSDDPQDHEDAKRICKTCPVFDACFARTVQLMRVKKAHHGTWAGIPLGPRPKGRPRAVAS